MQAQVGYTKIMIFVVEEWTEGKSIDVEGRADSPCVRRNSSVQFELEFLLRPETRALASARKIKLILRSHNLRLLKDIIFVRTVCTERRQRWEETADGV